MTTLAAQIELAQELAKTQDGARCYARSASCKTDHWPNWFVADRTKGDLNVTAQLVPGLKGCLPFLSPLLAVIVAHKANKETPT